MGGCERCGASPQDDYGEYGLYDHCASCSKNLCEKCIKQGCCGHVPALSGRADDRIEAELEAAREEQRIRCPYCQAVFPEADLCD